MGLNLWDVAAHALAQTPLVAVAVAALYALFRREFHKLREEVARLRGEVAKVGESVRQLARVFHAYGTALVHALSSRGVLTGAEAVILTGLLDLVPPARTKYYTEEARRRLVELLRMGAEGRLGPAEMTPSPPFRAGFPSWGSRPLPPLWGLLVLLRYLLLCSSVSSLVLVLRNLPSLQCFLLRLCRR